MARKRTRVREAGALTMPEGRKIPRPQAQRPDMPAPEVSTPPPPELADVLEKAGAELAGLVRSVRACEACVRASDRRAFGSGYPRARVLLVKERPSVADLRAETAFVDEAPALERAFARLGMPLWSVYGSTAVRCATRSATTDEARACCEHLLVEIEAVEPEVVVAFGDTALDAVRALGGRCGITVPDEVPRGEVVDLRPGLRLLWTEPLPAGVTEGEAKRRLWRDLQALPKALEGP